MNISIGNDHAGVELKQNILKELQEYKVKNYGTNSSDEESVGPKVAGFVIRDLSPITSNWRSTDSLNDYLQKHEIPGIEGVDSRAITKRLRTAGSLKACLSTEGISDQEAIK